MFDVISPFINLLWPILVAIAGFIGLFLYGRKKKAEGAAVEREKSREAVRTVEREMEAEVRKPRTVDETKRRLDRGDF